MLIKISFVLAVNLIIIFNSVSALNDGLVRTPPMGWLSWERFECNTNCEKYPHSCINEQLYKDMADHLAADGFKELGYEYVNIDDCWSEMERDSQHKLVADKKRFPHGIKALADYMHSKGLKLGIYGDVGPKTCAGYPAQNGKNGTNYFEIDAKTFAEWGVDSFKFDGCNEDPKHFDDLYPKMGKALNESGRPIVYICEWPMYQFFRNVTPNYDSITKYCHVFRNHGDIFDTWDSVKSIIDFYGQHNEQFLKYNGPGQWFDPDMLVIGNHGLSFDQSRTQMALWAIWSSPLYMSNDLRQLKPEFKQILQNKAVIAVNQDKHGIMGKRVWADKEHDIWVKAMEPIVGGEHSYAVVYSDRRALGDSQFMSHQLSDIIPNAKNTTQFVVHDLFQDEGKEVLSTLKHSDKLELLVNNAGGVRMVKLVPKE